MRSSKIFLVLVIAMIFSMALTFTAEAGILSSIGDSVKGFVTSSAVQGAVTALFIVLAGIFGVGIMRFKKPIMELYDVYNSYRDAKLQDGTGGSKITKEEWNIIFKEFGEAVMALLAVAPGSWAKGIPR